MIIKKKLASEFQIKLVKLTSTLYDGLCLPSDIFGIVKSCFAKIGKDAFRNHDIKMMIKFISVEKLTCDYSLPFISAISGNG